ncbi:MAG: dipeptide/oligopeptide/nickel ABC transporter permease/ATP-binding protein [Acetobacteraceae bacterium]
MIRYLRRNQSLSIGIALLSLLALFVIIGNLTVDTENARPLSVRALQPPSWEHPFGTDRQGRDLLAAMVAGTPLTLKIGFVAGFLGVGIGTVLAFIAGYYRGMTDTLIRGIADIGLTVPGLLVLIIIAVSVRGGLTVDQMAIVVASLSWLNPTRTIRSQVLTLRERGYVEVARLNGMTGPEIILRELMPNLLPYLAATLGERRLRRDPRLDRPRGPGPRPAGSADARHDAVLDQLQRRDPEWLVVVVGGADRHHPDRVPGPVLPHRRPGRDRQSPPAARGMNAAVLRVEGLRVSYDHPRGAVRAVDDVSFSLRPRERFGLAGESGSGKSTMALAILRLIRPPGRIDGGEVWLDDTKLSALSDDAMRRLRLAGIALVPQGSMNALNPVLRIRAQIADALGDHDMALSRRDLDAHITSLLGQVGLASEIADRYPHELSGGMKQRACIAIAICLRPKVIIADEPTSALDVVVQRQVMATLGRVQQELGAAVILVGHDMGLMAQFVDRLGVMYAGRLVEIAPVGEIITAPQHPYTQMLIASLPSLERKGTMQGIPGLAPLLRDLPPGCAFHPRCPRAVARCQVERPELRHVGAHGLAACHLA